MQFTPSIDLGEALTMVTMAGGISLWCMKMQKRADETDAKIAVGFANNDAAHKEIAGKVSEIDRTVTRNTKLIEAHTEELARQGVAIAAVDAKCHTHHPGG